MKRNVIISLTFLLYLASSSLQEDNLCLPPQSGICIDVWKCSKYTDLHHISDPRPRLMLLGDIKRNFCGLLNEKTPKVCCPRAFLITTTTTSPPLSPPSLTSLPDPINLKASLTSLTTHKNFNLLPKNCGEITVGYRITGGTSAKPGEYPWMALIAYNFGKRIDFRCGGTIINEKYVLTAAHCVDHDLSVYGVRLGEFNILDNIDCDEFHCEPPTQDVLIDKILIHPLYDASVFSNDIALIRIATRANFSLTNIQPICLPFDDITNNDLLGKRAFVSGWGITEQGEKSAVLRKTVVPIVPLDDCKEIYKRSQPITTNQICAGGQNGQDSCSGDSGGPLKYISAINGTPHFVQYGIVSFGPNDCGANGRPGVYTNVGKYMNWILDNLEP